MNFFRKIFIFPFIFFITVWSANIEDDFPKDIPLNITSEEFYELLRTVADGWNEGNARKAADCFTEDAVYTEPPDKQVYTGREELFEFLGATKNLNHL